MELESRAGQGSCQCGADFSFRVVIGIAKFAAGPFHRRRAVRLPASMAASVAGPERRNKMNAMIPKASELGPDVEFFNVHGVPVAVDDVEAFRYDSDPPAMFDLVSVMNEGVETSRAEFMALLPS